MRQSEQWERTGFLVFGALVLMICAGCAIGGRHNVICYPGSSPVVTAQSPASQITRDAQRADQDSASIEDIALDEKLTGGATTGYRSAQEDATTGEGDARTEGAVDNAGGEGGGVTIPMSP